MEEDTVPHAQETQEQKLLQEFDRIAGELLQMGIRPETLTERLSKGGKNDA